MLDLYYDWFGFGVMSAFFLSGSCGCGSWLGWDVCLGVSKFDRGIVGCNKY